MNRRNMKARIALLEGVLAEQGISLLEDGNFYKTTYKGQKVVGFYQGSIFTVFLPKTKEFVKLSAEGAKELTDAINSITYPEIINYFSEFFKRVGVVPGVHLYTNKGGFASIPHADWNKPYEIEIVKGVIFYRGALVLSYLNQDLRLPQEKLEEGDVVVLTTPEGAKSVVMMPKGFPINTEELLGCDYKIYKQGSPEASLLIGVMDNFLRDV